MKIQFMEDYKKLKEDKNLIDLPEGNIRRKSFDMEIPYHKPYNLSASGRYYFIVCSRQNDEVRHAA